jgi:hypothetical protein
MLVILQCLHVFTLELHWKSIHLCIASIILEKNYVGLPHWISLTYQPNNSTHPINQTSKVWESRVFLNIPHLHKGRRGLYYKLFKKNVYLKSFKRNFLTLRWTWGVYLEGVIFRQPSIHLNFFQFLNEIKKIPIFF